MRFLLFLVLTAVSAGAQIRVSPSGSRIQNGAATVEATANGDISATPASGGAVNIVTGTTYLPAPIDFTTTVSPTVSGAGHASLSYDGTLLKISYNGAAYANLAGAAAAGTLTGDTLASNVVTSSLTSTTGDLLIGGGDLTFTGASTLTGGAGNMTITSGTGNSRTLTLRTTTSGGTATTALTLNVDQSAQFANVIGIGAAVNTAYGINITAPNNNTEAFMLAQSANAARTLSIGFAGMTLNGTFRISTNGGDLELTGGNGGAAVQFITGGAYRWSVNSSGHLLAATDNSYDIGASGATRPRSIYIGTSLIISGGAAITKHNSASATLDFGSTLGLATADLTVTVTGAALGDTVCIGVPNGSIVTNSTFFGWVSAADTITIRFAPLVTGDPASGTFRADYWKH